MISFLLSLLALDGLSGAPAQALHRGTGLVPDMVWKKQETIK